MNFNQSAEAYEQQGWTRVSTAALDERVAFIRRTYAHLLGAVLAFIGLEFFLFQMPFTHVLVETMINSWGFVLIAFVGMGWLADWWARRSTSRALQYLGLGLYVAVESVIFLPLLFVATYYSDPSVIPLSAITALTVFAGLTVYVFSTKKDFSFLRAGLVIASLVAIAAVFGGLIFGFNLGLWFSIAMIVLASGFILYQTSSVLHHYRTDQHVAAALALFSSLALLFYYILRIFARD